MDTLTAVRSVRLVVPALLVMCALLATACGSGQVAQTATQVITAEGANAQRGGVAVRGVLIPTPARGSYQAGEPAPLYLAISTEEGTSDTLIAVTSHAAASVALIRSPFGATPPAAAAAPSSSASPSSLPAATPAASPAVPSASPGGEEAGLKIGDGALVVLARGASYLELQDLTADLKPGDTVSVTFSFARAGDITIDVPVATPDTPGTRLKPSEGAHE